METNSIPAEPVSAERKTDLSVGMAQANVYSLLFAVPFAVVFTALFIALWGLPTFADGFFQFLGNLPVLLLVFVVGIVVHEIIHALAWAFFSKRPLKTVRLGFQWKTLTPYAHCTEPLEVNAYRLGALMPGLLLGILPALAGVVIGSGWLLMFGIFFTAAAGGDLLILWLIRKVPAGRRVEDHPTQAGCYILE